ncbi:MAG: DUF3696 domain-containing protein [Alphaproteobacteria bacterium GM202ARS2]|nr:DUF3696 domain-containing protein [Alphaproteobacteria bacterium GM202ARS2]
MLKRLRIQNFKGWRDTGDIRLAPLSVFFGANSSGKSSIGQFLMMLKQTRDFTSDRRIVFLTDSEYDNDDRLYVQLGSYREMVYRRDASKDITFSYDWSPVKKDNLDRVVINKNNQEKPLTFSGHDVSFVAQVGFEDNAIVLKSSQYGLQARDRGKASHTSEGGADGFLYKLVRGAQKKYDLACADGYELRREQMRPWPSEAPLHFYGFPDDLLSKYQGANFLQDFSLLHDDLLSSIFYLGPLRKKPSRFYTWSGHAPQSVKDDGANAIAAFLAAQHTKLNFGGQQRYQSFSHVIAYELKRLGLIDKFDVQEIAEASRQYEVKLWMKGNRDYHVNLPDVGFGISQVLPVVIQCFYAPPESIILMEQPEIHLHPSAQASLADVMIDVIHSKEQKKGEGINRNIQLLIETHSEQFLVRLQRRIAEGTLRQDDVALYFVNTDKKSFSLEALHVNERGDIENWPKNFFGDQMGDIFARADAADKKQQK